MDPLYRLDLLDSNGQNYLKKLESKCKMVRYLEKIVSSRTYTLTIFHECQTFSSRLNVKMCPSESLSGDSCCWVIEFCGKNVISPSHVICIQVFQIYVGSDSDIPKFTTLGSPIDMSIHCQKLKEPKFMNCLNFISSIAKVKPHDSILQIISILNKIRFTYLLLLPRL